MAITEKSFDIQRIKTSEWEGFGLPIKDRLDVERAENHRKVPIKIEPLQSVPQQPKNS